MAPWICIAGDATGLNGPQSEANALNGPWMESGAPVLLWCFVLVWIHVARPGAAEYAAELGEEMRRVAEGNEGFGMALLLLP